MSIRRLIYSVALYFFVPIIVLRLLLRSRKKPEFRNRLAERFGFAPVLTDKPVIWLHAVSVGETLGAKPLVYKLIEQYPKHHILITNTTLTGSETAKNLFGDQVKHAYFPYDLFGSLLRFLNRIQPEKLIIMETEIWPNLYFACHQRNIPILLANARLSNRSMKSYLKLKKLVAETLENVCLIAARGEEDVKHFKQLGTSSEKLEAVGNIKFDLELPKQQIELGYVFREAWGSERLVWVAASTHQGEDASLLEVHQKLLTVIPSLLLVIVPRHPERFDEVYELAVSTSLSVQRRSQQVDFMPETNVIIGDSMGEMFSWFAAADVVFMGGSLVETGGHNPLEPAALAKPVVSGPHTFNFAEVFLLLETKGAAWVLDNKSVLEKQLLGLLLDAKQREAAGKIGQRILQSNHGVTDALLERLERC